MQPHHRQPTHTRVADYEAASSAEEEEEVRPKSGMRRAVVQRTPVPTIESSPMAESVPIDTYTAAESISEIVPLTCADWLNGLANYISTIPATPGGETSLESRLCTIPEDFDILDASKNLEWYVS